MLTIPSGLPAFQANWGRRLSSLRLPSVFGRAPGSLRAALSLQRENTGAPGSLGTCPHGPALSPPFPRIHLRPLPRPARPLPRLSVGRSLSRSPGLLFRGAPAPFAFRALPSSRPAADPHRFNLGGPGREGGGRQCRVGWSRARQGRAERGSLALHGSFPPAGSSSRPSGLAVPRPGGEEARDRGDPKGSAETRLEALFFPGSGN